MNNQTTHRRWGRFAVVAGALVSFLVLPASAAVVPATVETTGASVTTTVLSDQSKVVKFLADGTFTVPAEYTARVLLATAPAAAARAACSKSPTSSFRPAPTP